MPPPTLLEYPEGSENLFFVSSSLFARYHPVPSQTMLQLQGDSRNMDMDLKFSALVLNLIPSLPQTGNVASSISGILAILRATKFGKNPIWGHPVRAERKRAERRLPYTTSHGFWDLDFITPSPPLFICKIYSERLQDVAQEMEGN